ncbi:coiled-coil domain-containing protein [Parachryseolinea silvisoli]|uniref:hypothetical protein n=1 Tax=Parachryseolinea silvisoli TaxID=2873601 RepID=UPI0022658955|nr:hypothetical protein [Parachryseolinea silvisoli]MCD9017891.1 hypothetical protein [Parachryseolinea silvisoli]
MLSASMEGFPDPGRPSNYHRAPSYQHPTQRVRTKCNSRLTHCFKEINFPHCNYRLSFLFYYSLCTKTLRAPETKSNDATRQPVATPASQEYSNDAGSYQFIDNRPEAIAQRKFQEIANHSQQSRQAAQRIQQIQSSGPAIETGPPALQLLPCGHRSEGGVIQRLITEPPPSKPGIELLETYVFGTPVNKRRQTFEQAATAENNSKTLFEQLVALLDKGDAESALDKIHQIIERVNTSETNETHHPNPQTRIRDKVRAVEFAKEREAPYTISETTESVEYANRARKLILESDLRKQSLLFMLGVLVLPNGQRIVALSGNRSDVIAPLAKLLLEAKFPLWGDMVYDKQSISGEDDDTYKASAREAVETDKTGHFTFDKNKLVRTTVKDREQDLGSYPATCAAAVALSVAKSVAPTAFAAGGRMGLTEVLISTNENSEVTIYNKETGDGERFGMKAPDVPSCHVCQMQLNSVARQVVALERAGIAQSLQKAVVDQSEGIEGMNKKLKDLYTQLEKERSVESQGEGLQKTLQTLDVTQHELNEQGKVIRAGIKSLERERSSIVTQLDDLDRKIADSLAETKKLTTKQNELRNLQRQKEEIESIIAGLQNTIQTLQADQTTLSTTSGWGHAPMYSAWYGHLATMQSRKGQTFSNSTKDTITADLAQDLAQQQSNLKIGQQSLGKESSTDVQNKIDALQDKRSDEHKAREDWESDKRKLKPSKEGLDGQIDDKNKELDTHGLKKKQLDEQMGQVKQKLEEVERAGRSARSIESKIEKLKTDIARASTQLKRTKMSHDVYKD